ncbi:hypothetical protein RclHR1_03920008 [Rhizophagus clarus]|uniref:Uncharacterized protein n=1 Tax=Rhizophagus clarus TaxID=94130 RepID=A0A2Z6S8I7_9GLOM|nr:hypothetical protein RclHR1_03920008 [Rhizophagus clarus]GES99572.1 hypothetical protein RCL_jg15060.t1 [Rhizophagus clarus]
MQLTSLTFSALRSITVATAGAAEFFNNFADYRIDLSLLQYKLKASTQQIVAANILKTICYLSTAAFLNTVIFPTLDQVSREMEKRINVINKSHQLKIKAAINKKKSICIDLPDDSPKMEIDMDAPH